MATFFTKQQKGVTDGTSFPNSKHDGRQVGAARRETVASKVTADVYAAGDVIYLGRKSAGHTLTSIGAIPSASLGSATIAIGIGDKPVNGVGNVTNATKYCAATTITTADRINNLGPKASTLAGDPPGEEHLYATLAVAGVGAGVDLAFLIGTTGID